MEISLEKDKKIYKDYIIIKDLVDDDQMELANTLQILLDVGSYKDNKGNIKQLIEHLKTDLPLNYKLTVAQKGSESVISFGDTMLIFENTKAQNIRNFLKDESEYKYKFSIKTAEYHTYCSVNKLDAPDKQMFFGGAVTPKGGFTGKFYLRNDDYYDAKYFKGDLFIDEDKQNPHFDRGSVSVEFSITEKQFKSLMVKFAYDKEAFWKKDAPFNFIGIRGDNCVEYADQMFRFIDFEGHFCDYYRIDELDDRDMGIFYYQYSRHLEYIPFNLRDALDHATNIALGEEASKIMHKALKPISYLSEWLYGKLNYFGDHEIHVKSYNDRVSYLEDEDVHEFVNLQNIFSETALHTSLKSGSIEFAQKLLELGADVDIKDFKGHSCLYVAASLKPSLEKNKILEKMLDLSKDVNSKDLDGYEIPLTAAIKANDGNAVKLIIEHGGDVSFINSVKDNLINIALMNKAYKVIEALYEKDNSLIFYDNLDYQIPIVTIHGMNDARQILPEIDLLWENFDKELIKSNQDLLHVYWDEVYL